MKNITEAIQLIGTHNIHSRFHELCTGKSLSEALILTATNLQYDIRLFIEF